MSEWKLARISEYYVAQAVSRQLSADRLTVITNDLSKEISAKLLWPGIKVRLEFRGYDGYDTIVDLLPLPLYSSNKGTIDYRRAVRECPMTCISQVFATHARFWPDARLLLQTSNGGALNITNYEQGKALKDMWLPTFLHRTTLNNVYAANKNVLPVMRALMVWMGDEANQESFDFLEKIVFDLWCAFKEKSTARSPEMTLAEFCDYSPKFVDIDTDTFFEQVLALNNKKN